MVKLIECVVFVELFDLLDYVVLLLLRLCPAFLPALSVVFRMGLGDGDLSYLQFEQTFVCLSWLDVQLLVEVVLSLQVAADAVNDFDKVFEFVVEC